MSDPSAILATLESASAIEDTTIVVRSSGAVAEVRGPLPLRSGSEWIAFGAESGSHVHLKLAAVRKVSFTVPAERNAAIQVLGDGDSLLCRISFRNTNPARDSYDEGRAQRVRSLFGPLETQGAT